MSESRPSTASDPEVVRRLREAAERYREAEAAVEEHGREDLETVADAVENAKGLLLQYEDTATDTGRQEFVNFAQFKSNFVALVEGLDDDLPGREAFEDARECVDKSRLSEGDFERAREALAPAEALAERLDEHEDARTALARARGDAADRQADLREETEARERLLEFAAADLDAPTEDLRDPIETWNDAVREGVETHHHEDPARETLAVLDWAERFPLVEFPTPPEGLREYLESTAAGELPVATLLEYADYSRSKLSHYVDDADRLKREVATERTFLESLDADPLTVGWPPPPAERVPWLARELRAVGCQFVDDEAVAALRRLETTARDRERYERLRTAATASVELDADDRQRLADGTVEDEIAEREAAIERIDEALAEVPDP